MGARALLISCILIGLATVSAGLPVRKVGAARDVQLDDPAVLGAAAEVVKFLNAQNGATYQKVLSRVVSGTQQVVAGTMYVLAIETERTDCTAVQNTATLVQSKVWVQLWREASQKYKVMLLPTPEDQKSGIPRDSL